MPIGDLRNLIVLESWGEDAACAKPGAPDPDAFHSEAKDVVEAAARFCFAFCTVRTQCLEDKLAFEAKTRNTRFGVAGGFTPRGRTRLVAERHAAARATDAGATS
ncbi:WhiB family transcriptional regulator [Streptomyces fagopyri]|uniref:WhiB family transcriptional regulator n=1 Tax=Streptomyces fagopyri TaxID=2662397 RepID=UPI003818D170